MFKSLKSYKFTITNNKNRIFNLKLEHMALTGKMKEKGNYSKYVGLFNAYVIAVNPTKDELGKLLGANIEKDIEYSGANADSGAKKLTLSFWLKEEQNGNLFNVRFNIEDTVVVSKTGKPQWINSVGSTSYSLDKNTLPDFFTDNGRTVRAAKKGEELLYKFLRSWLTNLNYEDPDTELVMDWKQLISGKTVELKEAIDKYKSETICCMATVRTADDGKEYQAVYSYEFLPSFALDCFTGKAKKQYKSVDKFIEKVTDKEYGCKDFYELKPLVEYDPKKNVVNTTNSAIITGQPKAEQPVASGVGEVSDDLPF